ncbi:unnamed protein product [Moneuplotes crassus]|uniref:Uncharacterized protein n=1 Tax=Euplotes crassus TaxID=5936 RepID=A0AAD1XYZ2_EUPCR|nr:unnamed protein product [Moneuplotes crassus]
MQRILRLGLTLSSKKTRKVAPYRQLLKCYKLEDINEKHLGEEQLKIGYLKFENLAFDDKNSFSTEGRKKNFKFLLRTLATSILGRFTNLIELEDDLVSEFSGKYPNKHAKISWTNTHKPNRVRVAEEGNRMLLDLTQGLAEFQEFQHLNP